MLTHNLNPESESIRVGVPSWRRALGGSPTNSCRLENHPHRFKLQCCGCGLLWVLRNVKRSGSATADKKNVLRVSGVRDGEVLKGYKKKGHRFGILQPYFCLDFSPTDGTTMAEQGKGEGHPGPPGGRGGTAY